MIPFGIFVFVVCLLTVGDAAGRGGRGGGGGMSRGGGGMSRPRPSVGRSPSISQPARPTNRPSTPVASRPSTGARPSVGTRPSAGTRPSTGARPGAGALPGTGTRPGAGARPSPGDLQNFLNIPRPSTGAIGGAGAGARPGGSNLGAAVGAGAAGGAAAAFLRGGDAVGRPGAGQLPAGEPRPAAGRVENRADLAGNRTDRAQTRTGRVEARTDVRSDRTADRPARIENRQQWQDNRVQRRDEVRNQVQENHPRLDFWSDYPGWAARRITRPYRWATWGAITGWLGYGWSEPVSYSYGDTVYYEGDTVYQGDQVLASADDYAQQAETIAASAPEAAPANAEWMPLGVFAVTPDGQSSGPDPSLFLQLAISKEGIISGTFNNSATGKTQSIEGMADKKSQRCAWTVAGQSRPIMETGISNLTQDTAPALVHFADGQTQQWLMVRLEEPAAQQ